MSANLEGQFYVLGSELRRRCPGDERGDNIEARFTSEELAREVERLLNLDHVERFLLFVAANPDDIAGVSTRFGKLTAIERKSIYKVFMRLHDLFHGED